jgi:glycosyltransferase involved in cell wall biosynthesis
MNLVTIIVPVFNRFAYAQRALESVLSQSYNIWELIIVDDNSNATYFIPDFCIGIKQNVTLLRNEKNLGPGLSRQKALDLAKGEYVCFLDSDDFWKPNFLSESLKVHEANPELAATYCQSEMTDGSLRRRNSLDEAVDDIFYGVVSGVRPWATCSLMWRKKYLAKWNHIRTNQDALFELECSLVNSKIAFIPQALCVIDKTSGSNSEDLVKKARIEENRNKVLRVAIKNAQKYQGEYKAGIKKVMWKRLYRLTAKQFKYKNYRQAVINIFMLMTRIKWMLR